MITNKSSCEELKAARQALLLSLDDAHEALNINREYLEILEDPEKGVSTLAKIIAPVYAHGYYRIYTQYLGIQQQQLFLKEIKQYPVQDQKIVTINANVALRKPVAMLKEDSAINKVIPTVCTLVVLVTILILAR